MVSLDVKGGKLEQKHGCNCNLRSCEHRVKVPFAGQVMIMTMSIYVG